MVRVLLKLTVQLGKYEAKVDSIQEQVKQTVVQEVLSV